MNPFGSNKIYYHPDRLAEWEVEGDTRPVTVEVDITDKCCNKCPRCVGGRDTKFPDAKPKRIANLFGELHDMDVRAIIFSGGGEPLMHKGAAELIWLATHSDMDAALITNGVLLDVEKQWFALEHLTWLRVSLDATNAGMYREVQGVSNFYRVLENVRKLVAKRGPRRKPTLGVGYLVDSTTLDGAEEAARIAADLGVDYIQFRPYHHASAEHDLVFQFDTMFDLARQHEHPGFKVVTSEHKFRRIRRDRDPREKRYTKCYGQAFAATICANGEVVICCHMRGNPKYVLGNIYKNTFKEIWESERRQKVIENIDFADCIALCRCDPFNEVLSGLKEHIPDHVNFL